MECVHSPVSINTLKQHWIDTRSTLHWHLNQHSINTSSTFRSKVHSFSIDAYESINTWPTIYLMLSVDRVLTRTSQGYQSRVCWWSSDEILHFDKQKILDCFSSSVSKINRTHFLCFYQVIETLTKVWENSKNQWKHLPVSCVPTAFLILQNFHLCFYSLTEAAEIFLFLNSFDRYHHKFYKPPYAFLITDTRSY